MMARHSFVEQSMDFQGELHDPVTLLCNPAAKGICCS
jgi:hypothetical protein